MSGEGVSRLVSSKSASDVASHKLPVSLGGTVHDDERKFVDCARIGLWVVIASNALFAVADLRLSPDQLFDVYALKGAQILTVLAAFQLLRTPRGWTTSVAIVVISVALVCALIALSGALTEDLIPTVMLCLAMAWGTATLLPWGAWPQLLVAVACGLAALENVYLLHGTLEPAWAYTTLAVGLGLAVSVYFAHVLERFRRAVRRETLERQRSEAAVRRMRDDLETEVRARTAELDELNDRLELAARHALAGERRLAIVSRLTSDYAYAFQIDAAGNVIPEWLTETAFERITGYRSNELAALGGGIALVHPDDRAKAQERLQRLLTGEVDTTEFRIITKAGAVRWIREHGFPELDEPEPGVMRIYAAAQDITEQKRAQAALEQSEEQKRALLEVAREIAGTLDLDTLIERVQRCTVEVLPCDMAMTFVLETTHDVIHLRSAHGVPAHLLAPLHALRFSGYQPFDGRLRHGQTLVINDMAAQPWLSAELVAQFGITALIAAPVQTRDRYFGSLVVCNVGERRFDSQQVELLTGIARQLAVASDAAEQYAIQKEETEVSTALARVSREIVTLLGTRDFLDRLCRTTAEVLGADACHTLLARPDEDVYVPVAGYGATPEEQEVARVIKVPRSFMAGLIAKLEHADVADVGTIPPEVLAIEEQERLGLAANLCIALRRGATLIGVHVVLVRRAHVFEAVHLRIARGISQLASLALEHARVVEELNQASRLKSEFVATMSHELRTPINIISGYADLLLSNEFGSLNPDQSEVLRRMTRSARELFELINTTLDLGRFEAGHIPLLVREVDLAELIDEVRAETAAICYGSTVTVLWPNASELPRLRSDAVKLKAVLKNLVTNALKFTDDGSVRIDAERVGGCVVVSVADTGIGIAEDVLPIIFEPFRQADASTTRRYGGVGLGLYIVKRFVDLLGGTVSVESTVGCGSTFRVSVPLEPKHETDAPRPGGDLESDPSRTGQEPARTMPRWPASCASGRSWSV